MQESMEINVNFIQFCIPKALYEYTTLQFIDLIQNLTFKTNHLRNVKPKTKLITDKYNFDRFT